jgi:hypothetical protein
MAGCAERSLISALSFPDPFDPAVADRPPSVVRHPHGPAAPCAVVVPELRTGAAIGDMQLLPDMLERRRAELTSFPWRPRSGSACQR